MEKTIINTPPKKRQMFCCPNERKLNYILENYPVNAFFAKKWETPLNNKLLWTYRIQSGVRKAMHIDSIETFYTNKFLFFF